MTNEHLRPSNPLRILLALGLAFCLTLTSVALIACEQADPNQNEYGTESLASIEEKTRSGEYTESDLVTVRVKVELFIPAESTGLQAIDDMMASIFGVSDNTSTCTISADLDEIDKVKALKEGDIVTVSGYPEVSDNGDGGEYFSMNYCTID